MTKKRTRRTLDDEIAHTESLEPHQTVSVNVSMTRGLYLQALRRLKAGDYSTISAYVADMIRQDKYAQTTEAHGEETQHSKQPRKLGFEREGKPFLGSTPVV